MNKLIFVVGTTNWGDQYLHELIRYCLPINVVGVSSHFQKKYKANFILYNFNNKIWNQSHTQAHPPPPPQTPLLLELTKNYTTEAFRPKTFWRAKT